tara:strand:+ start:375 stop:884 length:510 start_codon:yes stop_codon:yes gene_type:complete
MGMQLIETIEVGVGGAASIEFTGIPQDGVDLLLQVSARMTDGGGLSGWNLKLNSSSANFSNRFLRAYYHQATPVVSGTGTTRVLASASGDGATSNTFGNAEVTFSNYTSATGKSWSVNSVAENNSTTAGAAIQAGLWNDTSAITSILIEEPPYSFMQYSSASLYMITAD